MSYQVLARKWRPKNFSEVAGQGHVLRTLINALDNQRLHHAYLFTGTRGVGKTTLARILAKCLNCETDITSTPCGMCNACKEIKEGRFIDLIEVDAASRTKVEDTRELLENVQYSPASARFKVYLIDEVHMLSNHSFNALLKTLEEPPPHTKFLFATTDPQKLPVTILSRCLQFNLKPLSSKIIADFIMDILKKESVIFDEEGVWDIAGTADGSMRDALTLLDQGISYCKGQINSDAIREMLGVPDRLQSFFILQALAEKSAPNVIKVISQLSEGSPDFKGLLDNLLSLLHRLAIAQVLPESVENNLGDREQILNLSESFLKEDLQLYYQMGCKARVEIETAPDPKTSFEMLMLRMITFSPASESLQSLNAINNQKKKVNLDGKNNTNRSVRNDKLSTATALSEPKESELSVKNNFNAPNDKETSCEFDSAIKLETNEDWLSVFLKLNVTGMIENVLSNAQLKNCSGEDFYFRLDENAMTIYNDDMLPKLSSTLSSYLNRKAIVHILSEQVDGETPSKLSARLKQEARQKMLDGFQQNSNVQKIINHFSGEISISSISIIDE